MKKKKKLILDLRSWSEDPQWSRTVNLLEPHISEDVHKPKGDPLLTQGDYQNIQMAEAFVSKAFYDIFFLYKRSPERYAQLQRFLSEAENRIKGARQMCEQLMFDGDPTYSGRPKR